MDSLKRIISFDEPSHTYKDEKGLSYISVTTVIQKYYPKFDEQFWAKKEAEKTGLPVSVVLANWKQIRDYSCEKGNKEHKLLEDSINASNGKASFEFDDKKGVGLGTLIINNTNLNILQSSPLASKYPKIYSYLRKQIEDGWTLYAEKRTYWAEYLIAGTIDCLLVKGKLFMIVDWKTNKDELKFKSGYYKKVNGIKTTQWVDKKEYFFKPLNHIENCKGNIYTMQLSLYAYILELWGYKCVDLVLFHIRDNMEPTAYIIKYLKSEAQLLLIDNKNVSSITRKPNSSSDNGIRFGIS